MNDSCFCDQYEKDPFTKPGRGEEIVISGIAGKFPDSHNVYHFRDNLFNKVDMVSGDNRRWEPEHPEVPQRTGKLYDIEKFDRGFFGITKTQSDNMDPQNRMVLERVYEAIIDAGYSPNDFAGTNTAVVVGICFSETEKSVFYDNQQLPFNDAITGVQRSSAAARISYYLKTKGPSFVADTACSSSLYAIQEGYRKLVEGKCDKAIIAASNICLSPKVALQFARMGALSIDGACKSFDNAANGYVRAEGIVVILLERAKDAKRIYAEIVHSKTNCDGHKEEGITFPSSEVQKILMNEFYEEIQMDPATVTFIEAHGTGTKVGDPVELRTLDEIFCKGRNTPLLIGSTKSNIGHSETASGLCSIVKVVIGMETGFIPPNIHYKIPRQDVESLVKGRMVVVTEKTPIPDDRVLFGINSFGFGGANGHLLLHWNTKAKVNQGIPEDNLPRLICLQSRNEEGVSSILDDVQSRPLDAEYVYLIQQAFRKQLDNNLYRGFGIFSKQGELLRSVKKVDRETPKLYLVFSNFDKEYLNVGQRLKELPIFKKAIKTVSNGSVNDDFFELIKNSGNENFVNQLQEIMALQISMANALKNVKLVPNRIIGFGSGELIAAYVDDSLTLKQTVLGLFCLAFNLNKCYYKDWDVVEKILYNRRNTYDQWKNSCEKNINSLVLLVGADLKEVSGKVIHLIDPYSKDPIIDLLSKLGSIYEYGFDMELDKLYPTIELPVSRGTPMLSPLIKWKHADCYVDFYNTVHEAYNDSQTKTIAVKSEEWSFVVGHVIDGRNVFPGTGYLCLVWECFAMICSKVVSDMKIVFEDVKYLRATNIPKEGALQLLVTINIGTHDFEVAEGDVSIVTGKVYEVLDETISTDVAVEKFDENTLCMDEKDIYKELKLRGYHYSGLFRSIKKCSVDATQGIIHWESNWIAFTDCLLQILILHWDTRSLHLPTSIGQLIIDAPKHLKSCAKYNNMIPTYANKRLKIVRTEGIQLKGLIGTAIGRRKDAAPVLEISKFIPNDDQRDVGESVKVFTQIVLENTNALMVKVVEVCPPKFDDRKLLCPIIQQSLDDLPSIQQDLTVLTHQQIELARISVQHKSLTTESKCLMLILTKILETTNVTVAINAVNVTKGFIISREDLETDMSKFLGSPFIVICSHRNENEILVLLRPKIDRISENTSYLDLTDSLDDYQWLGKLQEQIEDCDKVVLYSQNDDINGLLGLSTCLLREQSGAKIKSFLIMDDAPKFDPDLDFYRKQLDKDLASNIWKDRAWGTYRHLPLPESQTIEAEHTFVNIGTKGDLSTLMWSEGYLKPQEQQIDYDQEFIHIYYSALNFKDLMVASGKISPEAVAVSRIDHEYIHGFEFAGRNSKGERVMGMCSVGALASVVLCDNRLIFKIPDGWSMEEASTALVVYGTVLHTFDGLEMKPGKSILIHSGTGGIGLAAINLCLYYGLEIFVTVGTQEKRDYLKKHYPQIKDDHIGNSRDTTFEDMVYQQTNGRGVDYVLNSLAEEKLLASVRCLARGGHFLEIGKFDLSNNSALALNLLKKDAHFVGIALERCSVKYNFRMQIFNKLFPELIKKGGIKPLPRTIFKQDEVEQAFRFMGLGKHIGKVIIKIRDEEEGRIYPVPRTLFKATPRFSCDPSSSYLICGGLGGFGLELADLLVMKGAKNLMLTSKSGLCNGYQKYRIRLWESYGVQVRMSTAGASTEEDCTELLKTTNEMGPVDGIFNLAVVLRDALFENQTEDNFRTSVTPKAHCTKNLDNISRKLCPNLRYFVVFSSVSCGRGNAGQTNYGLANSVMERICEKRKKEGYPGLAIQWGAIGEVGLVAAMQEDHKELVIGGTLQQRISSCLQVMDKFLRQDEPIVASMVVAEKKYGGRADNLFDAVLNILGISNLKSVSVHSTFPELGMDSMMTVEIKQTLEREYEVFLSPQEIRGMTLAKLKQLSSSQGTELAAQTQLTPAEIPEAVNLLLRYIGTEELPNEPVIRMKTLMQADEDAPHVLVLPGLEGMFTALVPLCEKLRAHVSCVQFCPETKTESVTQLATSVLSHFETTAADLIILAYSFGCVVAVELLHILEGKGKQARVIFMDGSPEVIVGITKAYLPKEDDHLFQINILSAIMMRFTSHEHILNHQKNLAKLNTYQEKINYMVAVVPFDVGVSTKYIIEMCVTAYDRLNALHKYKLREEKLKSPVTLFKASSNLLANSSSDYGLSNTFESVLEVVVVEGNHTTMLENDEMAKEINMILGGLHI